MSVFWFPWLQQGQDEAKVDLMKLQQLRQSFPDAGEDDISQLLKMYASLVNTSKYVLPFSKFIFLIPNT